MLLFGEMCAVIDNCTVISEVFFPFPHTHYPIFTVMIPGSEESEEGIVAS